MERKPDDELNTSRWSRVEGNGEEGGKEEGGIEEGRDRVRSYKKSSGLPPSSSMFFGCITLKRLECSMMAPAEAERSYNLPSLL